MLDSARHREQGLRQAYRLGIRHPFGILHAIPAAVLGGFAKPILRGAFLDQPLGAGIFAGAVGCAARQHHDQRCREGDCSGYCHGETKADVVLLSNADGGVRPIRDKPVLV